MKRRIKNQRPSRASEQNYERRTDGCEYTVALQQVRPPTFDEQDRKMTSYKVVLTRLTRRAHVGWLRSEYDQHGNKMFVVRLFSGVIARSYKGRWQAALRAAETLQTCMRGDIGPMSDTHVCEACPRLGRHAPCGILGSRIKTERRGLKSRKRPAP